MSNEEFASTIRQFEEVMGISEFDIDTDDTIGNLDKVTLSFENDVLSFENDEVSDNTVEDNYVEETYVQPKLTLSKEEYNNVLYWLDDVRKHVNNKSLKKKCAQTKDFVIKGSVTCKELYDMLEDIKKQVTDSL